MLGELIKFQIATAEKAQSVRRHQFLCSLPENTFQAIYDECFSVSEIDDCCGARYNGVYYSEWEIYFASLDRDSDAEVLL